MIDSHYKQKYRSAKAEIAELREKLAAVEHERDEAVEKASKSFR